MSEVSREVEESGAVLSEVAPEALRHRVVGISNFSKLAACGWMHGHGQELYRRTFAKNEEVVTCLLCLAT